ncbi:MAG: hypothetical protein JNL68_11690 [Burkholderiales bacterium]|nr:hypothetical protein [Burkholderiales bacterium]
MLPCCGRVYNVLAFPFAAGMFYPLTISREVAALAMSGSSLLVVMNALLLKRAPLKGVSWNDAP